MKSRAGSAIPALVSALALCLACGGGCPSERAAPPSNGKVDSAAQASKDWLLGKLPAEVYSGQPVSGGTLTVRLYDEPQGLNRLHDGHKTALMVRYTVGPIYETLLELDRDDHPRYQMKPLLAESYEESPNRLTQVLKLRRDVRFHNGEPFTSRDVKAVMDALTNPKNPTRAFSSSFTDLAGYETPDDYTFVIRWKKPYYLGFRNFATGLPIMPASALQGDFNSLAINRSPIGTGPFKFAGWEPNKAITLVRNEDYWGKKPYLEKVLLKIVKDDTVATRMFERSEFDLMIAIQPAVWREMEQPDPKYQWAVNNYNRIHFIEYNYSWIGWNQERPFFQDRRVRVALGMLIPYDDIFQNVDLGLEIPTTCPFYVGSQYCDPEVQRLRYNPGAARKLLAEAGWVDTNGDGVLDKDGIPLKFTLVTSAHSVRMGKIDAVLQEQFRKAGIEMDVEKMESEPFMERRVKRQFDAIALKWANLDVEEDLFELFHSSQVKGANHIAYRDAEADRLLEASRAEFDFQKRVRINRQIHQKLYQDQVYYFISTQPTLDAVKKNIRGIKPSIAWYDLRKIWIQR